MRNEPKEPIPFQRHRAGKVLGRPYKDLKGKLKADTEEEYKTQRAQAEREYKASLAKLKADTERKYLNGRLTLIEQRCGELGILERFRFSLERARKEEDSKKLNGRLSRIERAIIAIEEEARIRQQLPYNLAKFFAAAGEVASMSLNRIVTHENAYRTKKEYVKHYPWEEGSNQMEVETITFDDAGGGPDWVEEEWLEWTREQEARAASQPLLTQQQP